MIASTFYSKFYSTILILVIPYSDAMEKGRNTIDKCEIELNELMAPD